MHSIFKYWHVMEDKELTKGNDLQNTELFPYN